VARAAASALANGPAPAADAKDGKALFLEAQCNTCHTVKAAGIEKRKATEADAAEAKEKKSDTKPPDLSGVGLERKAEWIGKFLMKTEAIKGEKHPRKFRGTEADLKTVSEWLGTMKTAAKK
jgi:mono/diheme cytochrome c family protein